MTTKTKFNSVYVWQRKLIASQNQEISFGSYRKYFFGLMFETKKAFQLEDVVQMRAHTDRNPLAIGLSIGMER